MAGRFDGKVLLTTGGGSGLAAAVARRFSRDGGRVAVLDMRGEAAHAVAAELPGSIGLAVTAVASAGAAGCVTCAIAWAWVPITRAAPSRHARARNNFKCILACSCRKFPPV